MAQADVHELSEEMDIAFDPQEAGAFELARMRHSAAHLMAEAIQELYPDVKFAITTWISRSH
jgi:threonyl-tRNA synthetase